MKKSINMDINVGIGDHIFLRVFMDGIKDQYDRIAITHSRPGMTFWHNDNMDRWNFNLQLGSLIFREPPYILVPNARFPFYPNARIVQEINKVPVKPNLDILCVGKSLDLDKYVVVTTKVREFPKDTFDAVKEKLTVALQKLAAHRTIVILGEREVEKTREYEAECNRNQVFGLYDYYISALPADKIVDLTVPALGITTSPFSHFQQDCLILKEAEAAITLGIGGNLWMSVGVAKQTIGLRADNEWTTDLMQSNYPGLYLTKDIEQFSTYLEGLYKDG